MILLFTKQLVYYYYITFVDNLTKEHNNAHAILLEQH